MAVTRSSRLLVSTHELCELHDPGAHHPERPKRLEAVMLGIRNAALDEAVGWVEAPQAEIEMITKVHSVDLVRQLEALSEGGGGAIDADTIVSANSAPAALRAVGAGLDLIERLDRGEASVGWAVIRPPGHHATPTTQMGFCLFNNVAVAARHLADRGERVAVVDLDAHHGNGTQDAFYDDPRVLFVSFHQYPWYPYTGHPTEIGSGPGERANVNVALPAGTTGDIYRDALESAVGPVLEQFAPTWLLLSIGFDAHRRDPLTDMGITSADYADLVGDLLPLVPPGRRLMFLEGGYDLQALTDSSAAVAAVAVGENHRPEKPTAGGPGASEVATVRQIHLDVD